MKKDATDTDEQDSSAPSSDDGKPPSSPHRDSRRKRSSSTGSPSQERFEKELLALARAFPDMRARFEFLYGSLNVLDSKASFLLGFNAIALAAVALWLEDVEPNVFHLILDAVFLAFLASSFSCLWAIAMHWSSADDLLKAFPEQKGVPPVHTPLIEQLLKIRDERTRWFRRSRVVSLLAVIAFASVSSVHAYGTVVCVRDRGGSECTEFSDGVWGHKKLSAHHPSSSATSAPVDRARAGKLAQRWLEALRRQDLDLLLESTTTPVSIGGFSTRRGPGAEACARLSGVRDIDSARGSVAVTAANQAHLSQTLRCLFLDNLFVSYIPESDGGEWPLDDGRVAGIRVGGLSVVSLDQIASALQLFRADLASKEGTHHLVQGRMTDNNGVTNHVVLTLPKNGPELVDGVYINELFEE